MRQLDNFNVITLVPFSEKRAGHIGTYFLGSWPFESGGTPKTPAYANPAGFIEVTRENADTPISAHFKLRDFLTKDQPNVWPKYLLLNPKLLDKLELTIQELEAMGHPVHHYQIMSGFRTPEYNHGGGNTQGRANLSRHMYGDASDTSSTTTATARWTISTAMAASTSATPRSSWRRWSASRERIRRWSAELAFIPHVADMARSRTSTCAAFAHGGAERAVGKQWIGRSVISGSGFTLH